MGVTEDFEKFCKNIRLDDDTVETISNRCKRITQRLNIDFWDSWSETNHSFYSGSYGRGTETKTSDIDLVMVLPSSTYWKYDAYSTNGQSALLQAVKSSIEKTYSSTDVGGDGQVVVVRFSDGMRFEVVPAFECNDGTYLYPDSNNGGSWKSMDPKAEINAFNTMNAKCNKNLKRLCRMAREWNQKNGVCMKGIIIDSAAYRFISDYEYKDKSYLYYDWMSRDFMKYLYENADKDYWVVPGSGWHAKYAYSFKREANEGYERCIAAIKADGEGKPYTCHTKWREHYGSKFPM